MLRILQNRAGIAWAPATLPDSKVNGVQIGLQLFSFRDLPHKIETIIQAVGTADLNCCELWAPILEPLVLPPFYGDPGSPPPPPGLQRAREELREWRLGVSLDYFQEARKKFTDAGIQIHAYNYPLNESCTDPEIGRAFAMAQALGAKMISAPVTVALLKRAAPIADRLQFPLAVHNHVTADAPDDFCGPASLSDALAESKNIALAFDAGFFSAAGHDPVAYIREHHDRIGLIRLKDKPTERGSSARYSARSGSTVQWGWANTPIKEVLQLLKAEKYPIPAMIEYEYEGDRGPIGEVKRCYNYCRAALV